MTTVPTTLAHGRYQVGALIGHGGMAEVHVGTDTRLSRQVAIKIMRANLANDPIFLGRFRREAHAVAQLNNPNIVSIYDSDEEPIIAPDGQQENVPYLVMEYVKGQTLREIIKENGALSPRDAGQIIIGVLNALEYSHRMGIIHRDIKPGNIMISDQGVVKVMDFGIARAMSDAATSMTRSQGVVGTAQYLSPEQARGESVDMRSDLYSAGCVLYEMLTGKPPFTGESPVAIAYQHVSEVAVPPSTVVPGLPKIWDSVVAKAMAKDRQNRYATATEFKNDVLAILKGGPVSAASYNPVSDLSTTNSDATQVISSMNGSEPPAPGSPQLAGSSLPWPNSGTNAVAVAEERAEAEVTRKKRIILWSVLGSLLFICVAVGIWIAINSSLSSGTTIVPTLNSDISQADAKSRIESAGFIYNQATISSDVPTGMFVKQNPSGGTRARRGSVVTVWFSTGPTSAKVPNVTNMTQKAAQEDLKNAGFTIASINIENSPTVAKDHVTRTDPAAGTSQAKGTAITIFVSSGQMSVPDVVGKQQAEAQQILSSAGFSITIQSSPSTTVEKGAVISTNPAANAVVAQKSMITITVSDGAQTVQIPQLKSGTTVIAESQLLQALGVTITTVPSEAQANWIVLSITNTNGQSVAGQTVNKGSSVVIHAQPPQSGGSGGPSQSPPNGPGPNNSGNNGSSSSGSNTTGF